MTSNPSDATGVLGPVHREPEPPGLTEGVVRVAGVAERCETCSALLDVDGTCWYCAPRCGRCDSRGGLFPVADCAGATADVCAGCASEWVRMVVNDFVMPLGVFTGRATEAEAAEHTRLVAERAAAEQAAADRKAARAAAQLRKRAEQVAAMVAMVEAADRPLRKRAACEAAPFGFNAAEQALAAAVRAGRLLATPKGYVPTATTNNTEKDN